MALSHPKWHKLMQTVQVWVRI